MPILWMLGRVLRLQVSCESYELTTSCLLECDFGRRGCEGVNFGCPIRRVLETVGDFSELRCSSVEDPGSSEDMTMY